MPPVINFDALKALHDEALRGGNKSGAWFQFSLNMMDAFPILTQQATRIASLEEALRDLVAQIELHTDCMDGHRDLSPDIDGDGVVERHEWLKTCPGFDVAAWLASGMRIPQES